MQTEGVFVGHREAARRLNVSQPTLRARVRRGDLTTWKDPLDDRRKLLRVSDLEDFLQPRPARQEQVAELSVA
jgi:excisionase family DNA binding protein